MPFSAGHASNNGIPRSIIATYAAVFSLVGYLGWDRYHTTGENREKLSHRIAEIDRRPSVQFRSAAMCKSQGFSSLACEKSNQQAMWIAQNEGTDISLTSAFKCTQTYGKCGEVEGYKGSRSYHPYVIGWQALADDLNVAVPLYSTPNAGQAIRYDGKILALD